MSDQPTVTTTHPLGGCPECGRGEHMLNIRKMYWGVCPEHKTKWEIGYGIFSSWEHQTEDDWKQMESQLQTYREVEPLSPAAAYDRAIADNRS